MTNGATDFDSVSELRDNVRNVIQSPAFKAWKERIEGQIQMRQAEMLRPAGDMNKLVEQEYMKGEVIGMMNAVELWRLLPEELQTEINRLIAEKENPNDASV